jgi:hypothetical protein
MASAAGQRPHEDRARVEAERRLQAERARAAELARVREHQYPLPSYYADARITKDVQRRRQQLREARSTVAWRQATMVIPAWAAPAPSSCR